MANNDNNARVALVTGGATRIGAEIVRTLHDAGLAVVIHYNRSAEKAEALAAALNHQRPGSASLVGGDLLDTETPTRLMNHVGEVHGRLDVLVNNASTFYPTPVEDIRHTHWDDLMGTNLKAPFFLALAAVALLRAAEGCIVNLVDIHAYRPKKDYLIYSMAKAANAMMVKTLARELAPQVRVNGVAPGVILWPENDASGEKQAEILARVPLGRAGTAADIARAVRFMALEAGYVTGQVLPVDGGRTTQQ
ncbi:MAG: pteridine reductase [Pseudomonadota bacterium]